MNISDYVNIFTFHGKGFYAMGRVLDTFLEVHLYDFFRKVNTASIKTSGYTDKRYMIYQPVYTSVCREMIRKSIEWYRSGVQYSDDSLIPIYIDLGSGSGKTVMIASETGYFSFCAGVELDRQLHKRSEENGKLNQKCKSPKICNILGNVEEELWVKTILDKIPMNRHTKIVPFIFNKNSYNDEVVARTLRIAKKYFDNVMYLYQNPIHHSIVVSSGFMEVQRDSQNNNAHKNKKYVLYHYSKK